MYLAQRFRDEAITAVTVKIPVFWDVTPCILVSYVSHVFVASFKLSCVQLLLVGRVYCCSCLVCIVVSCLVCIVVSCLVCIVVSCLVCIVVTLCVFVVLCVYCCFYPR